MTEDNPTPESPHFGIKLRKARESQKLSLKDVGNRLRLNANIIHLLESGNFKDKLPPIFIRGYLKSYANLLNFNRQDIEDALLQSRLTVHAGTPSSPHVDNNPNTVKKLPIYTWAYGLIITTLVLSVLIWWNAYPVTLIRKKISALVSLRPVQNITQPLTGEIVTAKSDSATEANFPVEPEIPIMLPNSLDGISDKMDNNTVLATLD